MAVLPYNVSRAMTASGHRRTVIASGLLCCALILVVLFTTPVAFRSPAAVVVMALIGTAAVLIQLRLRNDDQPRSVRPPLWLNILGILLSLAALFPTVLHLGMRFAQPLALGAVSSFAVSSAIILHSLRKQTPKPE
jgi:type IV secretory pathway TrbD component